MAVRRRACFLDKDGTLLVDVPYNVDPARMTPMETVSDGLARLAGAGFRLVVVSNQSGAAEGRFAPSALEGVEDRLRELFADAGVALAGCFWCVHARDASCACRKPAPGLLRHAAGDLDVDLGASWMVGDILDDVEAGHAAGCRAALVDAGRETERRDGPMRRPDVLSATFVGAAAAIVGRTVPG